jgi:Domain of unknown function (DUF1906)
VRTPRWLTTARAGTALAVTATMVAGTLAALPAGAATDTTTVTYRGVSVTVPSDWPVVHLDGQQGCVRLDRHAVYLGDPATTNCPATITGHVEGVHLTDGVVSDARSPLADLGAGREITGGTAIHPDLVVSHQKSPVRVVVTSGAHRDVAQQVADSVAFNETGAATQSFSANSSKSLSASPASSVSSSTAPAPALVAAKVPATYTGLGFDTCLTPSTSAIAAWGASPYRAVNMYIGGASRGCPNQPNLTPSWVTTVVGSGWTLIPTYVGLQAPCASKFPNRIQAASAAAQGTSSADDAIAILNGLGLGAGSIVYFDMEAYDASNAACVATVQAFLDAWTVRLHARDYLSGVYTSSDPMKPTLVDRLGDATFNEPDDIWFARWNGDPSVIGDPKIPDTAWATHQRIHQYMGGHTETYPPGPGGVTINIDNNSLDADTSPGAPLAEGTFLSESGSAAVYRIAGGAPLYVSSWDGFGGAQPVVTVSKTRFRLLPTFPRNGTFLQSATRPYIFRVQSGVASVISSWDPFGGPQPTTTVDDAALDKAGAGGVWNHLISAKPAVAMTGSSTSVRLSTSGSATWAPAIRSSAARDYDVRYRRAKWNSTFGELVRPASWQHQLPATRSLGLLRGYDYCVSVRARNWAGLVTAWSPEHCLTRPLDDRSLTPSSGWKLGKGASFLAGTYRGTTRQGATLRVSSARVKRIGIVATTCTTCGKVAVLVGGTRVGTINLHATSTHRKALLMLPAFSRRTGDVELKVKSSGQRVQIDGLALSRT